MQATLAPRGRARAGELTALAAERAMGRKIDAADERQARQAAVQLVSQLFFAPMLAEMRKTPFGTEFGSGGRTEEVFGEQLDLRISDAVAGGNPGGVVESLSGKLARSASRRAAALGMPAPGWDVALRAARSNAAPVSEPPTHPSVESAR